jgi:hypothetical protein
MNKKEDAVSGPADPVSDVDPQATMAHDPVLPSEDLAQPEADAEAEPEVVLNGRQRSIKNARMTYATGAAALLGVTCFLIIGLVAARRIRRGRQ